MKELKSYGRRTLLGGALAAASASVWPMGLLTPTLRAQERGRPLRVALVVSPWWHEDTVLLVEAKKGMERACKQFGAVHVFCRVEGSDSYVAIKELLAEKMLDLVITLGEEYTVPVMFLARKYPDVGYGVINIAAADTYPNVMAMIFNMAQGGFVCGALSALILKDGLLPMTGSNALGWLGGVDSVETEETLQGFINGVRFIDPKLRVLSDFIGNHDDPEAGRMAALDYYAKGAGIIMNYAGETGRGILKAASEANCFALGVDVDQDALAPGHVITSLVKRYDRAVYGLVSAYARKRFYGMRILDFSNYGLDFTDMKVMKNYYGASRVNQIYAKLHRLRKEVISGGIPLKEPPYYSLATKV